MREPARIKTRDRILLAARALFNAEGYGALSALDIAHALEISPGHLYYHFKGKAEIATALLDGFEAELALVLDAALRAFGPERRADAAPLETLGVHVHILLEESVEALFLFREPGAVAPERFVRALAAMRAALEVMLEACAALGALRLTHQGAGAFAGQIALAIAFRPVALALEHPDQPPRALARAAAAEIAALVATAV